MGLFDKFKKEPDKIQKQEIPHRAIQNMEFSEIIGKDSMKQIIAEYCDDKADFKQFYDTTRLIIEERPVEVNGTPVYSAKVAWYSQNDCVYLGENGEEYGRKSNTTDIKLQIDMNKLYTDPEYQRVLMTQLLEQKRVERYMQTGMQEEPEQPCGNYVGSVDINSKTGRYGKVFRSDIGKIIHGSPEMVSRRQQYRENQARAKEQIKARKQAEIERLQKEIDEL